MAAALEEGGKILFKVLDGSWVVLVVEIGKLPREALCSAHHKRFYNWAFDSLLSPEGTGNSPGYNNGAHYMQIGRSAEIRIAVGESEYERWP